MLKKIICIIGLLSLFFPLFAYPPADDDYLHTVGGKIYEENGKEVWLTGINWFGFETADHVIHGLWSRNWKDVINEIASLGFNIVRLPVSVAIVNSWRSGSPTRPSKIEYGLNADLEGLDSLEIFDLVHDYMGEVGLKIMLDMHSVHDVDHKDPLWYNSGHSTSTFISCWTWLVNRVKDKDIVVAADLFNEPHGTPFKEPGAIWDGSNTPENWRKAAEDAALAVLDANPRLLVLVEGIESYPMEGYTFASTNGDNYYNNWWGGNLRGVAEYPVNLGSQHDKLVYSPHDYGPAIWEQDWFKINFNKETLAADCWYPNWFYIQDLGIAPLLIGEWGGKMDGTDHPDNVKWMTALKDYIKENRIHFTFWCLNDNSGDTGGIYVNDFQGIVTEKYELVKEVLWQDNSDRFVGLDHQIVLESEDPSYTKNGTNVSLLYNMPTLTPPPVETPTPPPLSYYHGNLQAHYKCGETNQDPVSSQMKPHIKLVNIGGESVSLDTLKVYYYYTKTGFVPDQHFIDWSSKIDADSIIGTFGDGYFELSFRPGAGSIAANDDSGELQIRINKTDFSDFDQSNDYSFGPAVAAYEAYEKVVVFYDDELVWGQIPGIVTGPTQTPPVTTPTNPPSEPPSTPPGETGDVDGNGSVDIVDALMIAQYYVGLNPPGFNPDTADVNESGGIDIVDALMVAQYYVGLLPSL